MCDYSLMGVPSRLARQGEELVVYRFPTRSKGLASREEIMARRSRHASLSIWQRLKQFFRRPRLDSVTAVCIPPGAHLRLEDIPVPIQFSLKVHPIEDAIFTQLSAAANVHRDAIRFNNGRELSLQTLIEGQRVKIINLDLEYDPKVLHPAGLRLSQGRETY